jgi:hypothetical protein
MRKMRLSVLKDSRRQSLKSRRPSQPESPHDGWSSRKWLGPHGTRSLDDFKDAIWINSHCGQRRYPF